MAAWKVFWWFKASRTDATLTENIHFPCHRRAWLGRQNMGASAERMVKWSSDEAYALVAVLEGARYIAGTVVKVGSIIIDLLRKILNKEIEIPGVLTPLFKAIANWGFSMFSVFSLPYRSPITDFVKVVTREKPKKSSDDWYGGRKSDPRKYRGI